MDRFEVFKGSIDAMCVRARFFVTQRRKDSELYHLLADCMALCEAAVKEGFVENIRQQVLARASGQKKGRCYFEQGADPTLVIGRYIFERDAADRANAWRYIASLREAAKAGISAQDLAGWLKANGGVNALFRQRPVESRSVKTKTLSLAQAIECPKDTPFTLVLRRREYGIFEVVSAPYIAANAPNNAPAARVEYVDQTATPYLDLQFSKEGDLTR